MSVRAQEARRLARRRRRRPAPRLSTATQLHRLPKHAQQHTEQGNHCNTTPREREHAQAHEMAPQAEAAAYASSGSSESDRDESWDDYSADGDEQQQPATSLFEQKHFPSAQQALQHDRDQHGVDLPLLCATLGEPFQPG